MFEDVFGSEELSADEATKLGNSVAEIENETDVKKCPACGSNLVWNPAIKCLECEHCGTTQQIDMNRFGEELSFAAMLCDNKAWASETHVFQCNNCGAKEVLASDEIAVKCAFCGTTNVVETDEISGLKPNAVVPFNIDKPSACDKVIAWAKKRLFAPSAFKKAVVPEEMTGNYNPVFTFDTHTYTSYHGVLGQYYYVERKVNGKIVRERRTRYIRISGNYNHFYDDILVQASSTISQKVVDKLQPFNTNNCKEYSKDFLHGFTASQYNKDGQVCWNEARAFINKDVKQRILAKYSYDFVQSFNYNTSCDNITFKYLLLPIYVGYCKWRNKLFNFFVNGRSGKVTGKTPLSPIRVSIATILAAVLIAGIGVLAWYLTRDNNEIISAVVSMLQMH